MLPGGGSVMEGVEGWGTSGDQMSVSIHGQYQD